MSYPAYKPESAVPPGATLLEILCERFEEQSGINITTIERLIRGETPLTEQIAEKLEAATGVPQHLWLNLEEDYRDHLNEKLKEADAPFHCTYYTEGGGEKKWKMVICTSSTSQTANTTSPADSPNDAHTSGAPDVTPSQTANGKDTTADGAPSPTASESRTTAVPTTAS